jgi:hypothetical protein
MPLPKPEDPVPFPLMVPPTSTCKSPCTFRVTVPLMVSVPPEKTLTLQ